MTHNGATEHKENRIIVIYGFDRNEVEHLMQHFEATLPEFATINLDSGNLLTKITLTGVHSGLQLLRFQMNRLHQALQDIFSEELITIEDKSLSQVLGDLLSEMELTVSSAESCTGGNIAHKIVQRAGSSAYFLGSVVSYSNNVKADVLKVSRRDISEYGAVSRPVAESMARGVSALMQSDCAISTSGIAGPDGGTKFKPVGTVWLAAKYKDTVVSECIHFKGDRNEVIESATNHAMNMLINLLRHTYVEQEDISDE